MTTIFGWTIPPVVHTIFYGAMFVGAAVFLVVVSRKHAPTPAVPAMAAVPQLPLVVSRDHVRERLPGQVTLGLLAHEAHRHQA
jgi:hypothetical protein